MTRITIETDIDGSKDTSKIVIEDSETSVQFDELVELFKRASMGLGFSQETIDEYFN